MLRSSLFDYSDAYILVKGTIDVNSTAAADANANDTDKKLIFKNCVPFTNCISEINNTQIDNAKNIDIVMPMNNFIDCSDNYFKTSGRLWQYCKDIPAVGSNNSMVNFNEANATDLFNFKAKMTGQTGCDEKKMVPLKYVGTFWRTPEIPLTNCEINLISSWSENCVIVSTNVANQNATFPIRDTKLYIPVVTLSTQDNKNQFKRLDSGFKREVNWNKYLSKPDLIRQDPNLNHLVGPEFQGINRLFALAFENDTQRTSAKGYYLPNVELTDYNVKIDRKNFFDKPIKDNKVTYENIRKIATGQGDNCTTGCLLDYPYFKDSYKMMAVDLSKQQILGANPRANQQI